ncbi:YcjX family protein [Endozoicomonas sp. Mp262]|uniref:YcjX family protein n=1 Tax=Endozoicomonas sp. Mp262 TaxID=2919499 RepID=UPI0021D7E858
MFDTLNSDTHDRKTGLWNTLKTRSKSASSHIHHAFERFNNNRINVGITGFSRSGKTTLITSLLYQLLNHQNAALAAFSPIIQGQMLGARWGSLNNSDILFPYSSGIEALSTPIPQWPAPTSQETSCLLELRLKPKSHLIPIARKPFEQLQIAIHDYPGEWLIDIPMAGMSFRQWSHQWRQLLNKPPRQELAREFLSKITAINPLEPWSEPSLERIFNSYRQFIHDCRKKAGLTLIQPGMLCFGQPPKSTPVFFPLPGIETISTSPANPLPENCWLSELERRYRQYTETMIKPFIKRCLTDIDKQLVLVDVISGLSHGPDSLEDIRQSLMQVMQIFSYGKNNWLSRLFKPKIEQLIIGATKVDQVLPGQHEAVRQLTAALVRDAYQKASFCNIQVACEAIASVRSSTVFTINGQERLTGTTLEGHYGEMWHPQLPDQIPEAADWQRLAGWQPRSLLPPKNLKLTQGGRLPHIRLDILINQLIGDICQ